MPHSKSIKKVIETLVDVIENDLTDIQVMSIANFLDSFLTIEKQEDNNPNIFEDADKKAKGKKVKFVEDDDEDTDDTEEDLDEENLTNVDEDEDDDEDDDTPVAKKSKRSKVVEEDDDDDDDDDEETDDVLEDSDEDYDIDVDDDEDDEPKKSRKSGGKKSNKKAPKKVKFDPDDFDTWTVENIKAIRKDVAEYDIDMKLFKKLDDEEFVEKAIELVEACQEINKKLDKKSDKDIIKLATKNKIKVGKGKNARDDAQYKLYLLEVKKLK